jgi:hypothetical protein
LHHVGHRATARAQSPIAWNVREHAAC